MTIWCKILETFFENGDFLLTSHTRIPIYSNSGDKWGHPPLSCVHYEVWFGIDACVAPAVSDTCNRLIRPFEAFLFYKRRPSSAWCNTLFRNVVERLSHHLSQTPCFEWIQQLICVYQMTNCVQWSSQNVEERIWMHTMLRQSVFRVFRWSLSWFREFRHF